MSDQPDNPAQAGADEPGEATQLSVLPTPRPERTGVPAADAALDRIDGLGTPGADSDADLDEHVAVFDEVHARLQEALGSTDATP